MEAITHAENRQSDLERALTAIRSGHFDAAIAAYRRVLVSEPERLEVRNNLAALLLQRGQVRDAVDLLRQSLVVRPESAVTHLNLGIALKAAGSLHEAVAACRRALALEPEWAEAHYTLGGSLQALGRDEEAAAAYRRALATKPDWAEAHNRLGNLLRSQGRIEDALAALRRAVELRPDWHVPHHNMGQVFIGRGEPQAAIDHFREAIRRQPDYASSHLDMAAMLLATGAWEEGWREFEWRFRCGGRTPGRPGHDAPVWDGSTLDNKVVMVWIEQGLGDHIQFARYAEKIRERGGRVWLQTPRPLLRLYETLAGVERLVAADEPIAGFDAQVPLMSLPRIFHTTPESIPVPVPYLTPPRSEVVSRGGLPPTGPGQLRVGIVWASCQTSPAAARRDCDLTHFGRLARIPGVSLFALQFGERACDLRLHPELGITDLSDVIGDFATTAAFVSEMDLILSVDTAMAHLAGALGQRIWTLLSEPADWRWFTERNDCPWYPTMRLFRQPRPGDWPGVFDQLEQALRRELACPTSEAGNPSMF